jgi:endonuclease YncB( thermonuclease family)
MHGEARMKSLLLTAVLLTGSASIIDGDTLEIHGTRIRLWGIDAPESSQLCRGDDSLQYRCGARAANALYDYIARHPVTCEFRALDRYSRTVAVCSMDGADLAERIDLNEWLVRNGWALDWMHYSGGRYAAAMHDAQQAERGIWSGSFIEPWKYRACRKAHGKPGECSDGDYFALSISFCLSRLCSANSRHTRA